MRKPRTLRHLVPVLLLATACAQGEGDPSDGAPAEVADPAVVNVVAQGLTLVAPDEIPSGWVTFRFDNQSPMVHFGALARYPTEKGLRGHQEEIAPVFQSGFDLLASGEVDAALERFGQLPEWFGEVVFYGGPGLTSSTGVSEATVYLEPGTYVLECYVKTDGIFHSFNPDPEVYGMAHEFTVTEEPSGASEPTASLAITISSEGGIEIDGEPGPGEQTVAVHFADQIVHENFLGHDVHLALLAEDTDLDELAAWMDWSAIEGLQTPAPVQFVGGIGEMPEGSTGYFTVTLEPGRYAWISEVPNASQKNMLRVFDVGDQ